MDHVPALQDWQAETDDAPIVDDQDPAAHMLHVIGVVDVADCNRYPPAGHSGTVRVQVPSKVR